MTDADDRSEQLDGDVLGEEPLDPDLPGVGDYPPDRSLGVEDPSLIADDDLATRADLRRDIDRGRVGDGDERPLHEVVLVDPDPAGELDHDPTLTAEAADAAFDDLPAEEAAIHVVDE